VYTPERVELRYGIRPDQVPDFIGLKGDTSDNIPGVPGIGEKTASQLLQEHGSLEGVLGSIDKISGAKRKENLTNHAGDARVSKVLATAQRDVPVELDLEEIAAQEPDRSRLRETFREFELRDPLRRLEEALGGEEQAAPRAAAELTIEARALEVPVADLGGLQGELLTLAAERPGEEEEQAPPSVVPEDPDEAAPDEEGSTELLLQEPVPEPPAQGTLDDLQPLRFAAYAGGAEVLVGEAETLAALALSWGERPLVAHDWKSIASREEPCDAPPLEHDTMVAAYLIDPARRSYPLAELMEDEAIGANIEGANGLAERAVVTRALAERQTERLEQDGLTRLFREVELPLVDVLVDMERAGVKLDTEGLDRISERTSG
ncbi:MAG: 5'-3' exonuclease H3TH domain-containing protein, partial [Gaiellaceae bacterium]